jgi:hypothetical protein
MSDKYTWDEESYSFPSYIHVIKDKLNFEEDVVNVTSFDV